MPNLYIISGCNGAGKTTCSYSILPEMLHCWEFVNADEIAKGLSPFKPETVAIKAGRLMLERIQFLMKQGIDFAFETTLSTQSYISYIQTAHSLGYDVTLLYFWLESVELAIERVNSRVRAGGHAIPEEIIRRRYSSGIQNLSKKYTPVCDYWMIFDNSGSETLMVAEGMKTEILKIYEQEIYSRIMK